MERMRQQALDGAAGRDHGLADHLAAEHALPARLRAAAAEQIHLERFEVKDGQQVDAGFWTFDGISGLFRATRSYTAQPIV